MMMSNNGPLWTSMKMDLCSMVILILVIYLRDRLRRKDTLIVYSTWELISTIFLCTHAKIPKRVAEEVDVSIDKHQIIIYVIGVAGVLTTIILQGE